GSGREPAISPSDSPANQPTNQSVLVSLVTETHVPQERSTDRAVHAETVVALIRLNGVMGARSHDSVDRAAIVTGSGQSRLNLDHDRSICVSVVTGTVITVVSVAVVVRIRAVITVRVTVGVIRVTEPE